MILFLGVRGLRPDIRLLRFSYFSGHFRNSRIRNRHNLRYFEPIFQFFRKPRLKISYDTKNNKEDEDRRWGTIRETKYDGKPAENMFTSSNPLGTMHDNLERVLFGLGFYPKRRIINIQVSNNGHAVARNCEVRLRLLGKGKDCEALTHEDKTLVWEDGKTMMDIGVNSKRIFNLAFSQQHLTSDQERQLRKKYCGIAKKTIEPCAWLATESALKNQGYGDSESMCLGSFKVHVDAIEEDGNVDSKHFMIRIPNNSWQSLNAELMECDCQ
jgi:hypothetical protein